MLMCVLLLFQTGKALFAVLGLTSYATLGRFFCLGWYFALFRI